MEALNRDKAIALLNRIMECELAGVVRYTHYSLLVSGYNGDPVAEWLRAQADEGLKHARRAGKLLSLLGGHPAPTLLAVNGAYEKDIGVILRESLDHENEACAAYHELLGLCRGRSVFIEDYARQLIHAEDAHVAEVTRLLHAPREVVPYVA